MAAVKSAALKGLRLLDPVLALGLAAPACAMRLARRIRLERLPLTQRTLLALGVMPLHDHYYDPQFRPNGLTPDDLLRDRPLPGLDLRLEAQRALLAGFRFQEELADIPFAGPARAGGAYWFDNGFFERMDGSLWYSMLRSLKPRLIIEVGSGFSTLMARRALARNESEGAPRARHICIEPFENPWLERSGAEVVRQPVERVDPALFAQLGANDVLFIDSSHVIRPGGDVTTEMLQILPRLAPGVVAHLHDIFTPKDYPWHWLFVEHRLWNEQYLLEALLTDNPRFEVMLGARHAFDAAEADVRAACVPLGDQAAGSSFYVRRLG